MTNKMAGDLTGSFVSECKTSFKENQIVYFLLYDGKQVNLESPKLASEVICPKCQTKNGYYNSPTKSWGCLECLRIKNDPKVIRKHAPKIPSISSFGIPDEYKNANMKECDQPKELIKSFYEFIENPKGFLILNGRSGSGKTYASCAIVDECRKTGLLDCRFFNYSDVRERLKDAISTGISEKSIIDPLIQTKFLIFDDFGTVKPSESFCDHIYDVVQKRYNDRDKATVITTNLNFKEIEAMFGSRITSRIFSGKFYNIKSEQDRRAISKYRN